MRKTFKSSTHSTSQPGILNALKNNFSCLKRKNEKLLVTIKRKSKEKKSSPLEVL